MIVPHQPKPLKRPWAYTQRNRPCQRPNPPPSSSAAIQSFVTQPKSARSARTYSTPPASSKPTGAPNSSTPAPNAPPSSLSCRSRNSDSLKSSPNEHHHRLRTPGPDLPQMRATVRGLHHLNRRRQLSAGSAMLALLHKHTGADNSAFSPARFQTAGNKHPSKHIAQQPTKNQNKIQE